MLEENAYRDQDGVKYAAPAFVAALQASIKRRKTDFTVHDLAYVDFICKSQLKGANLQKASAKGPPADYFAALQEAKEMAGKTVTSDDTEMFKVAPLAAQGDAAGSGLVVIS